MRRRHKVVGGIVVSAVFLFSMWYLLGYNILTIFWQAGQLHLLPAWDMPLEFWLVLETIATAAFLLFIASFFRAARRSRTFIDRDGEVTYGGRPR